MTQAPLSSPREPSRSPRRGNPLVRLALLVGCVISAIILGGVVVAVVAERSNETTTTELVHDVLAIADGIATIDVPEKFKPQHARTEKGRFLAAEAVLWKSDDDDWLLLGKLNIPFDPISLHVDQAIGQLPRTRFQQQHWSYGWSSDTEDVEINGETVAFEITDSDAGAVSAADEPPRTIKGTFPTADGKTGVLMLESNSGSLTREQINELLHTIQ
ncbi:MAG: hypothetical protein O3B13_11470 [Planctomycetota bacterium]|nr:hypothetical protein [Planctomycetota bacterium]MDA1163711.1 hypothetical protein [Planctomycetota bacterium]